MREVKLRGEGGETLEIRFFGGRVYVTVKHYGKEVDHFKLKDNEAWKISAASRMRQAEIKEEQDGTD